MREMGERSMRPVERIESERRFAVLFGQLVARVHGARRRARESRALLSDVGVQVNSKSETREYVQLYVAVGQSVSTRVASSGALLLCLSTPPFMCAKRGELPVMGGDRGAVDGCAFYTVLITGIRRLIYAAFTGSKTMRARSTRC